MQDLLCFGVAEFWFGIQAFRGRMVYLFLREPAWNDNEDNENTKMRISLLNKMESVIKSFLMSGGRSEARLWLCNTIAGISSITRQQQCELFLNLLRSKPLNRGLASQVLQMIFEKTPHKAGSIIAKKSHILEKFFEGNLIFSHYAVG